MMFGSPEYLNRLLVRRGAGHDYPSRDNTALVVPYHRLDVFRRSFEVRGALAWNALPPGVRESSTVEAFKRGVKDFLQTRGVSA